MVDDLAAIVLLCLGHQPAPTDRGLLAGRRDDGDAPSLAEGGGLQAKAKPADLTIFVTAGAPDRHGDVDPLVGHSPSVIDHQQANEALSVTDEPDQDVLGAGIDRVVHELR